LKRFRLLFTFVLAVPTLTLSPAAHSSLVSRSAPDSTPRGPHATATAEYRFPATTDKAILPDRMTEIWARVFYPKDVKNLSGKAPLIVMLHGNHGTCGIGSNPRNDSSCSYTMSGTCPSGYVPTPNHEGYNYLAENLASWGYWVVSINANRGITCGGGVSGDSGLNLARGKLVLKHLSLLYTWSTSGGAPASLGLGADGLIGKIDFGSVGLFGHSRGGEGVRAAYNLYLDKDSPWPAQIPGLHVKAIFEVGAVDGQTSRVLDADGTVWNQLLPMCDGDVSDLQGRYPFERMLLNKSEDPNAQKSLYEVWGANHNFFNTEWQESDAYGCKKGTPIFDPDKSSSAEQQKVALASVPAFFRSRLGTEANPGFNQNFNPLDSLPEAVTQITQIDRDFTPSPGATETRIFEDFDRDTGTNSSGNPNVASQITIEHVNISSYRPQRAASLAWQAAGKNTYFESIWAGPSQGYDIRDFATLDFRIARRADALNKAPTTDFSIQLEDAAGQLSSAIRVSEYANINGPGTSNPVLKTVRLPLKAFQNVNLAKIRGVRFTFDTTKTGALYLANIRLQRQTGFGEEQTRASTQAYLIPALASSTASTHQQNSLSPVYVPARLNTIRSIRFVQRSRFAAGRPAVEIQVASEVPFPAMNRLPVLKIGDKAFTLSRYSDPDTLKELTFTLSEKEYNTLSPGSDVSVENGKIWQFGALKNTLK